jgi:hypothetical protein
MFNSVLQTRIVVTNKRVLLLSQMFHWGKPVSGLEEAFFIEDLKVRQCLMRLD